MGSRITAVEKLYYQIDEERPFEVGPGLGYEFKVATSQEPYIRTYRLGCLHKQVPLETGWIEKYSLVYIYNHGPSTIQITGSSNQEIPAHRASYIYPTEFNLNLDVLPNDGKEGLAKVVVAVFPG